MRGKRDCSNVRNKVTALALVFLLLGILASLSKRMNDEAKTRE